MSKIAVGKITKISKIEVKTQGPRDSIYDPIYTRMGELQPGEGFTIPIPKDVDKDTFHNRLNAATRRGAGVKVKPPAGCVFQKRTTQDGGAAIFCVLKDAPAKAPVKSVKGKKAVKIAPALTKEPAAHPQAT